MRLIGCFYFSSCYCFANDIKSYVCIITWFEGPKLLKIIKLSFVTQNEGMTTSNENPDFCSSEY